MTIYLVGPTAGYLDSNRKEFVKVAGGLKKAHRIDVLCQTQIGPECLSDVCGVIAMEGWRNDAGARLAVAVAAYLGKQVYELPDLTELTKPPTLVAPN